VTAESWGDFATVAGPGVTPRDAYDEIPIFAEAPANGGAIDGATVYGWMAV